MTAGLSFSISSVFLFREEWKMFEDDFILLEAKVRFDDCHSFSCRSFRLSLTKYRMFADSSIEKLTLEDTISILRPTLLMPSEDCALERIEIFISVAEKIDTHSTDQLQNLSDLLFDEERYPWDITTYIADWVRKTALSSMALYDESMLLISCRVSIDI